MVIDDKYLLRKPGYGDTADIGDVNHNTDLIANGMYQNRLMIGKAYDPDKTYNTGNLVVKQTTVLEDGEPVAYNFEYYKALEDNITGVWDSSKWELTDIATELATKGEGGADVTKEVSGNPVEFDDGANAPMVKCTSAITGSQDLHGYDKPWVGGAGKNKLNLSFSDDVNTISGMAFSHTDSQFTLNGTATTPSYYSLTFSTPPNIALSTDYTFSITVEGTIPSGLFSLVFYNGSTPIVQVRVNTTDSKKKTFQVTSSYDKCVLLMESIQNGGAYNCTIKTQLELGSTATSYAPYSNICPITAYNQSTISVGGRNLYPIKIGNDSFSSNAGGSASNDNGTLVVTATSTSFSGVYTATNSTFFNMTEGLVGKFTYSFYAKSSVNLRAILGITNYGRVEFNLTTTWQRISITATFPGTKLPLLIYSLGTAGNIYIKDFMIERGDTAHDYEEYIAPTTHTTTYPSAIYRGSEDCVEGEVTETMWKRTLKWGDGLNPTVIGDYTRKQFDVPPSVYPQSALNPQLSSCAPYKAKYSEDSLHFYVNDASTRALLMFLPNDTSADFEFDVVAEHLTPQTSSVTPTNAPVKSLLGYNHIESSTGDLDIEYITEDFQPIVDLIEANASEPYSDDYTLDTEIEVGTWVDGSTLYRKTKEITGNKNAGYEGTIYTAGSGEHIVKLDGCIYNDYYSGMAYPINMAYSTNNGTMAFSTFVTGSDAETVFFRNGWNSAVSKIYLVVYYTKVTSTRSLNREIPEEIKNAEYEEKPDVNEADDDAPTEVDER